MKKRYVLKKWVEDVIELTVCILVITGFMFVFNLLNKPTAKDIEAIEYCMEQGVSFDDCKRGYFGY